MKIIDRINKDVKNLQTEIPLLSLMSQEEIEKLEDDIILAEYDGGEYIFRSGDQAEIMYIIVKGFMKIYMNLSDGREQLLYLYRKDDFVGGLNLLTSDKYVYKGVALEKSVIAIVSKVDFHNVFLENKEILLKILEKSFERIRRSENLIHRLSSGNSTSRVAKLLIDLSKFYGKEDMEDYILEINLNREELGSYSGITRETISRKLTYFEELGLIEILSNKEIRIKNIKGIKAILEQ